MTRTNISFFATIAAALAFGACEASAAPCTHVPGSGGDPSIAGATALQIALCQAREGAGRNATAFIVHAAPGGGFDTEFGAWTFDLGHARLEIVSSASPNGESASSFRQRTGAAFAINGGFFDYGPQHELRPVGLFVENGQVINPLGKALSGTLLIAGHRVDLMETASVGDLHSYKFGLQSRPLLVEPGNKMGMRGNDGTRVPRSAVCLTDAKHVAFFYAGGGGLSLLELATLLQAPVSAGGFACDVALNLDGGPSTQVSSAGDGATLERGGQNVANAVVVLTGR